MSAWLRIAVVSTLLGAGLAGCGNGPIVPQAGVSLSNPDDFTVGAPITLVRLNTDTGNVTMTSKPGATTVSVRRVVHNESDRRIGVTTSVTGGVLRLDGCEPRCSIDYTLVVPPGVTVGGATTEGAITLTAINDVDVGSDNGAITLRDVTSGPVGVHSENGAITLRNVTAGPVSVQSHNGPITLGHITSGPISLRTENGQIRGTDLAGSALTAQSLNGAMELAVTTPQDVSVRTNNGSVALTLPDQPYAVSVSTRNGPVSVGVPDDPAARHHLELSAANGDITVRPAP